MRRISLFQNVSLDGYFEAPEHDISWARNETGPAQEDESGADTILLGHRTYDLMAAFWPTPQAAETAPDIARFMNEQPKLVASRKGFDATWQNTQVLAGDVVAQLRQIKQGPGGDIIMFGSNQLAVALLEAGLLDQVQLMLNPIALGKGTPLFSGLARWVELELTSTRAYPSGVVLLTYRPSTSA